MDSQAFTAFHVAISVFAIVSGFVAWIGIARSKSQDKLIAAFLLTSVATSVTGYFFDRDKILPAHVVGVIALVVLAVTIAAKYKFKLRGRWRAVFAAGVVLSLWFNVFVLIVQAFLKVPFLHVLAPKGSEAPFAITQLIVLTLFVVFGVKAVRRFHPENAGLGNAAATPVATSPPSGR